MRYPAIIGSAVAAALLVGCSASPATTDAGASAAPNPAADRGLAVPMAAAVFGGSSPTPIFTVQGVLTDASGPVTATLDILARVIETDTALLLDQRGPYSLDVVDGLFSTTLPLTGAEALANLGDLHVALVDANSLTPIGGPIPISIAPRAWAAEYANRAGQATTALAADSALNAASADYANQAGQADHAATADQAGSASTADIALEAGHAFTADALVGDQSVAPTYTAPFANYGSGYAPLTATRVGGMVYLTGLVSTGGSGPAEIANLPEGFRPTGRHIFTAGQHGTVCRVDVMSDGRISLITPPAQSWFSVSGISFPAAP